MASEQEIVRVDGRDVVVTNPGKVFFTEIGATKLDLVRYYLAVAPGALVGAGGRPVALKRFVNGAAGEAFFQKRAPEARPEWLRTVTLSFPSGRTADEIVVDDAAGLAWIVNLGCIDLNPHPVRADDLDHPDELRVDLDPVPGVEWAQIRDVAMVTKESLEAVGLVGWPKTSGSRIRRPPTGGRGRRGRKPAPRPGRAPPPVQPQQAQRPLHHPGVAAPQRASAPGMAWPARELVPGLRARRPPGQRPNRRSRRAARSRRRTARHRQLRRALSVVQLDQG